MHLYKRYHPQANREVAYEDLLAAAKTGDRIILYQGEASDAHVPGLHGVLVQCGREIFWNDNVKHPVFTGTCENFFPFGQTALFAKSMNNLRNIFECNGTLHPLRAAVSKTDPFEVQEWRKTIYIRYGNEIVRITKSTEQVIVNEPFDAWSVNNLGCIVQCGTMLKIIGQQKHFPGCLQKRGLMHWRTSKSCVFYTAETDGLWEWTGSNVLQKSTTSPTVWFVTQGGQIITLEGKVFQTLDEKIVYDGPWDAWTEHPHGVLIERDGDLVLAVVK
ncbi:MAG: hypothetical protein WCV85_00240 [Patescibacteria group bacterium]